MNTSRLVGARLLTLSSAREVVNAIEGPRAFADSYTLELAARQHRLLYSSEAWWYSVGGAYCRQSDQDIHQQLFAFFRSIQELQRQLGMAELQRSRQLIVESVEHLRVGHQNDAALDSWLERGKRRPPGPVLFTANGLLCLTSGRRIRRTTAWFSDRSIPIQHDPAAQCPCWQAFLDQTFPNDPDSVSTLQEFFGYCLVPQLDRPEFRRFLLLYGTGSNGKSVITTVLTKLVGEHNAAAADLAALSERFVGGSIARKFVNTGSEIRTSAGAENELKRFTGGDLIQVERKHENSVALRPSVKFVFTANAIPRFHDRSRALWDRLLLLHCSHRVKEHLRDPLLAHRLAGELPGILNWATEGWQRLQQRGRFNQPWSSRQLIHAARGDQSANHFIEECVVVCAGKELSTRVAYSQYLKWCESRSEPACHRDALTAALKGTGAKVRRIQTAKGSCYVISDVGLREPYDAA